MVARRNRIGLTVTTRFDKFKNSTTNRSFKRTALNAKRIAVNSIRNSKRGGKKWRSLKFVSSKPNNPPANQSGTLARSIFVKTNFRKKSEKLIILGAKTPYAARLEFGDSSIAARPFLQPAIDKALINYQQRFFQSVDFFN